LGINGTFYVGDKPIAIRPLARIGDSGVFQRVGDPLAILCESSKAARVERIRKCVV
jgi:hypothetical protein